MNLENNREPTAKTPHTNDIFLESTSPNKRSSRETALLEIIKNNPSDDDARLSYAQLLADSGRPIRAKFIQAQIQLHHSTESDRETRSLQKWVDAVEAKNARRFSPGVPTALEAWNLFQVSTERGFPHTVFLHPFAVEPSAKISGWLDHTLTPVSDFYRAALTQPGVTACEFRVMPLTSQLQNFFTIAPSISELTFRNYPTEHEPFEVPAGVIGPHITKVTIADYYSVTSAQLSRLAVLAPNLTTLCFSNVTLGSEVFSGLSPATFSNLKSLGTLACQLPSRYELLSVFKAAPTLSSLSLLLSNIHKVPYEGTPFTVDLSNLKELACVATTGFSPKLLSTIIGKAQGLSEIRLVDGSFRNGYFEKLNNNLPNESVKKFYLSSPSKYSDEDLEMLSKALPSAEIIATRRF